MGARRLKHSAGLVDRPRFEALDSLRGIACAVVVVNHCLNLFALFGDPVTGQPDIKTGPLLSAILVSPLSVLWEGHGAVAVFFVLSGFVLALPWVRLRPLPYRDFAIRRICRIYIPYIAAVALAMVLATSLAPLRPAAASHWFEASNWNEAVSWDAIIQHVLMLGGHDTFDNVIWSLIYEMRISLVFPLLLIPMLRLGWIGSALLAVGLYGGGGAITHYLGWDGVPAEVAATMRFATFFVLGAMLTPYADAFSAPNPRLPGYTPWLCLCVGVALLLYAWEPALKAVGAALVLVAALLAGRIRNALLHPWLRELGRISYSLYLTHLLVLLTAYHVIPGRFSAWLAVGVTLVASPLVAKAFNRLVEEPSIRLGHRLGSPRRAVAPALAPSAARRIRP
jgi:peptidoglycan/LPS O-acetylase OafA/YrhL